MILKEISNFYASVRDVRYIDLCGIKRLCCMKEENFEGLKEREDGRERRHMCYVPSKHIQFLGLDRTA